MTAQQRIGYGAVAIAFDLACPIPKIGPMKQLLGWVMGAWMLMAASLNAAPKIGGGFSYQFTTGNASVTLSLGAITNSSAENATSTILVQLWAMDQQYDGGRLTGHAVASYKLEGLDGGRQ